MNLQKLIPIAIIPAAIALLAGCLSYRILPLGSIPYAVAMVAVALAAFGYYDRVRYADESDETFTKRIALAYFWVIPAALVGWLISRVLWINPPWPALLGVAIAIYKARGFLVRDSSANSGDGVVMRGPVLKSFNHIRTQSEELTKPTNHGLIWGGVLIPNDSARSHFLVCGTTGSGKTKTIQMLMESVLRRIEPGSDCRALIYDAKGDLVPYLSAIQPNCPVHILNVLDQRGVAWDIAADMTSREDAAQLADSLCPDTGDRGDRFYPMATRAMLKSIILTLMKRAPGRWSLRDLINAANLNDVQLREFFSASPELEQSMSIYFKAREFPSVRISLSVALDKYATIAGAWESALSAGRRLTINDWPEKESILVLPNRPESSVALLPFNQLLVRHLASRILGQTESTTRQTWVFLDELADLGKIPQIPQFLAKGRSKGLCAVVGFQELAGLQDHEKGYGKHDAARLVGQCNNLAFLRLQDVETAEWASGLLGEQERIVELKSHSNSRHSSSDGENQHIERVHIVLPSQLTNLPPASATDGLTGYYRVPAFDGPWKVTLRPEFVSRSITSPDDRVSEFIPHGSPVPCSPWNADDLIRLNSSTSTDGQSSSQRRGPSTAPTPPPQSGNWQIPRLRKPPNA